MSRRQSNFNGPECIYATLCSDEGGLQYLRLLERNSRKQTAQAVEDDGDNEDDDDV